MLRPQDNRTRERKNLDGLWGFRLDAEQVGRDQAWFAAPLRTAARCPCRPATTTSRPTPRSATTSGPVWYQRDGLGARGPGQGGASCCTSSRPRTGPPSGSNDIEVVSHEGGYTPFEVDVTAHVEPGEPALVTVEVDNRLSFQTIPPGVVEDTPHGPRQRYWHDFFNYAGLHRSVWLYATDPRT